jgi:hypothetical protein
MDGLLNPNIAQLNQLLTLGSLPFLLNQNFPLNSTNQLEMNVNEESKQGQSDRSLTPQPYSPTASADDSFENTTGDRGSRPAAFNRIFVSYPRDATEYELNLAFKRFGTILDTLIIRDRHSKIDKGVLILKKCPRR